MRPSLMRSAAQLARRCSYSAASGQPERKVASHINTPALVKGFMGENQLGQALEGSDVVIIPAGVPRKPGMTRDDLFNINAGIVKNLSAATAKYCPNVLGYRPRSHLSGAQVLPRWFSSVASNGSPMQKSHISETNESGAELQQSDAQKSSEGVAPKVMAFSPLEAAITKPRSSPLTSESSKVRRLEIATQVTFYMIPVTLLVSRNSISTSLLVGAVFHQIYMFHKEILLDYVHHDITRKWSLIYLKLLLLVMAKDTIMYFNLFPFL